MSAGARAGSRAALEDIQRPVREQLDAVPAELGRIITSDQALVADVNRHLLQTRGKLFRPTLLLLSGAVEGRLQPRAVTLAALVELIHLATLVHDDSVDHSVVRRGLPTINSLFSHQVSVIMGDFLYTRAVSELVRRREYEALEQLVEASNSMSLGEMRQIAAVDALSFSEEGYFALIRAKTAVLFSAACGVGALCGAEAHRPALKVYGDRLGMAFQIADDLLDYTEAAEVTGKPKGLDLREHKVTLPLIHTLRHAGPGARKRIEVFFADEEPSDASIAEVVEIVSESGGLEYARERGERFAQEAEEALGMVPDSPARSALVDAIAYVMDRRW